MSEENGEQLEKIKAQKISRPGGWVLDLKVILKPKVSYCPRNDDKLGMTGAIIFTNKWGKTLVWWSYNENCVKSAEVVICVSAAVDLYISDLIESGDDFSKSLFYIVEGLKGSSKKNTITRIEAHQSLT